MRFNLSVDFTEQELIYTGLKAIIKSLSGVDPQNIRGCSSCSSRAGHVRLSGNGGPIGWAPPMPMPAVADIRRRGPDVLDKCLPIDVSRHMEASFVCCKCATVNAEERAKCRHCGHDRCGVIITPPPQPEPA